MVSIMLTSADNEKTTNCKRDEGGASDDVLKDFKHHVCERVKMYEANMKGSTLPAHPKSPKNGNNIGILVPVGILIVLLTLYLATSTYQRKYANYIEQKGSRNEDENYISKQIEKQQALEARRIKILEKLLEYKDLCTELEIFTKDLSRIDKFITNDGDLKKYKTELDDVSEILDCSSDDDEKCDINTQDINISTSITKSAKRKVQRRPKKVTPFRNKNVKSENNENNHSNSNNSRKDQPTAKKSNTAEPIIYLFALVFIYLLLKAASDINQHYKSQNKGDKRLRRCSLQSYAQTHKQDRRASKGAAKQKHGKVLLMEMRSKSVDRYNEAIEKKSNILANLRKYTSLDQQSDFTNVQYCAPSYSQPLKIWTNTSEEVTFNNKKYIVKNVANRRCSVPMSLNFQQHKINTLPIVAASNVSTRRTSLVSLPMGTEPYTAMKGIQFPDYGYEGQFQEGKRRVRMLNRH